MLRSVFGKTLWDQRRSLLAWAVGIGAVGVMYAAFYPSFNNPDMQEALKAYPKGLLEAMGMTDIGTAAGYLGSTSFGLLGPALIIVMAAALGSGAIAGDEDSGRLDLILAHPVSRWSVALQRFAALVAAMVIVTLVLGVALIAISGPAQLGEIGPGNLLATSAHLALLGTFFGALALGVGAATGNRGLVFGLVAVVAVVGYFGNNLGQRVIGLGWLHDVSPFRFYLGGSPLTHGLQPADLGVLALAAAIVVVLGTLAFDRRDLGT
jgi:beta-exotoxin I transport system permease protein